MSFIPTNPLRELGPQAKQAQDMAGKCKNERLAITLQCVAIGSMFIMAAATAAHAIKDLLRKDDRHGRSK